MNDGRTEPATPKRKREARKKGQVARSHDFIRPACQLTAVFDHIWGQSGVEAVFCVICFVFGLIIKEIAFDDDANGGERGQARFTAFGGIAIAVSISGI